MYKMSLVCTDYLSNRGAAILLEHTTMYFTINGWMPISNNISHKDGSSLLYNATAKVVNQWERGTIKGHFRVASMHTQLLYKSMY